MTLTVAFCNEVKKETETLPVYETPFIKKNDSPLRNDFNPRIEFMNLSSAEKAAKKANQQAKDTHRADLIRDFSVQNLQKWAQHLEKENINQMEEHDILDNISSVKVYSKALQTKLHDLGNNLKTQVGLFDLVLKEKKTCCGQNQGSQEW